jgi:hypothetical protein
MADAMWSTAVHEAGHVLGVRLAGAKIHEATIIGKGRYEGHVLHYGWRVGDFRFIAPAKNSYDSCDYDDYIMMIMLGELAELELGFPGNTSDSDYNKITKWLKHGIRIKKSRKWCRDHGINSVITSYKQLEPQHVSSWRRAARVPFLEFATEWIRLADKARPLAKKYRWFIERVARLLVEKKTITDEEIPQLVEVEVAGGIDPHQGNMRPTSPHAL